MKKCACPSSDPAACYTMRHSGQGFYVVGDGLRDEFTGREEQCSCSCHYSGSEDAEDEDWRYDHFDFVQGDIKPSNHEGAEHVGNTKNHEKN